MTVPGRPDDDFASINFFRRPSSSLDEAFPTQTGLNSPAEFRREKNRQARGAATRQGLSHSAAAPDEMDVMRVSG